MAFYNPRQSAPSYPFAGYGHPAPSVYTNINASTATPNVSGNKGDGSLNYDDNKSGFDSDGSSNTSESENSSSESLNSNSDETDEGENDEEPEISHSNQQPFIAMVPIPPHYPPHTRLPGSVSSPFSLSRNNFHYQPMMTLSSTVPLTNHQPVVGASFQAPAPMIGGLPRPQFPIQSPTTGGPPPRVQLPIQSQVRGAKRRRKIDDTNTEVGLNNVATQNVTKAGIVGGATATTVPVPSKEPPHPLKSKYPYLVEYGVPLGYTKADAQRREMILSELVRFQVTHIGQKENRKTGSGNTSNIDNGPSKACPHMEKAAGGVVESVKTATEVMQENNEAELDMGLSNDMLSAKNRCARIKRHLMFKYDYLIPFAQKAWTASNSNKFPRKKDVYGPWSLTLNAMLELFFYIPKKNKMKDVQVTMQERKEAAVRYILKYLNAEYRYIYVELIEKMDLIKKKEEWTKSTPERKVRDDNAINIRSKSSVGDDNSTKVRDNSCVRSDSVATAVATINNKNHAEEEGNDNYISRRDLIMDAVIQDNSAPTRMNQHWNLMYQRLIDYKELFGDFYVFAGQKSFETRDKSKDPKEKIPVDWKKVKLEMEQQQQQQKQQQEAQQHADDNTDSQMNGDVDSSSKDGATVNKTEKKSSESKGEEEHRLYCNLLAKWVFRQRNLYRKKSPELTPKRIELLESIGFPWAKHPDFFISDTNVPYHKAVAARLCFGLPCGDALLFAGFPKEEAYLKKRKKILMSHTCNLYKPQARGPKGQHIKSQVEFWMDKIYAADKLKNEELFFKVLEEIYGPSDLLNEWYCAGRIVLNRLHPSKRKRTDETLSEDGKTYMSHRPTGADVRQKPR